MTVYTSLIMKVDKCCVTNRRMTFEEVMIRLSRSETRYFTRIACGIKRAGSSHPLPRLSNSPVLLCNVRKNYNPKTIMGRVVPFLVFGVNHVVLLPDVHATRCA
jgi:hypothetical protein